MGLKRKGYAFAVAAASLLAGGQAIAAFSPGDAIVGSDEDREVENQAALVSESLPQLHGLASSRVVPEIDQDPPEDPWSNPSIPFKPLPAGATTDITGSNQYDWGTVEWGKVYDSSGNQIGTYRKQGDQLHYTANVPFYYDIPIEVIGVGAAIVVGVVAVASDDDSPTSP